MPFKSIVWLLDEREIRRSAVSGFLEDWVRRRSVDLREIGAIHEISERQDLHPEMCIFVTGGTSLAEPAMSMKVHALLDQLSGRPLVVLTDIDTDQETFHALQSGADALVSTSFNTRLAIAALDFILSGGTFFERSALTMLTGHGTDAEAPPDSDKQATQGRANLAAARAPPDPANAAGEAGPHLTPRQQQIVRLLKKGRSNKEIARILNISDATVKIFMRQLMRKFGAHNRTQVALLASDVMSLENIVFLPVHPLSDNETEEDNDADAEADERSGD